MKIAVTYEKGEVFQHFGHCESFQIYTTEGSVITDSQIVSAQGSGHGALSGFLKNLQVDALICGGIGAGARAALAEAGIKFYPGVSGSAEASVKALLSETLIFDADKVCDHHSHENGHDCGDHHHEDIHPCKQDKKGCGDH